MKPDLKFMRCKLCGNIVTYLHASGVTPVCCGEAMIELTANTEDAATEKHVPDVTVDGNKVTAVIGSVIHPMVEEHYIEFIALETNNGLHVRYLEPGQEPKAVFEVHDEELIAVYEYCNLHGLWKKEI